VHDTEIETLTDNTNISSKVKYKTSILGSTWVCETEFKLFY